MKLIVGLGNPGDKYKETRHNLGFLVVDSIANEYDEIFKKQGLSEIIKLNIYGEKVIIAKPQTFMNLSGGAVRELMDYYDIEIDDIMIISDDKDQLVGSFKIKKNSGHGGQNGIRNIIDILKTNEFTKLKIGVGAERISDTSSYVLANFNKEQKEIIDNLMPTFKNIIKDFARLSFNEIANKYNGK